MDEKSFRDSILAYVHSLLAPLVPSGYHIGANGIPSQRTGMLPERGIIPVRLVSELIHGFQDGFERFDTLLEFVTGHDALVSDGGDLWDPAWGRCPGGRGDSW